MKNMFYTPQNSFAKLPDGSVISIKEVVENNIDNHFSCPWCNQELTLRAKDSIHMQPHFKHANGSSCIKYDRNDAPKRRDPFFRRELELDDAKIENYKERIEGLEYIYTFYQQIKEFGLTDETKKFFLSAFSLLDYTDQVFIFERGKNTACLKPLKYDMASIINNGLIPYLTEKYSSKEIEFHLLYDEIRGECHNYSFKCLECNLNRTIYVTEEELNDINENIIHAMIQVRLHVQWQESVKEALKKCSIPSKISFDKVYEYEHYTNYLCHLSNNYYALEFPLLGTIDAPLAKFTRISEYRKKLEDTILRLLDFDKKAEVVFSKDNYIVLVGDQKNSFSYPSDELEEQKQLQIISYIFKELPKMKMQLEEQKKQINDYVFTHGINCKVSFDENFYYLSNDWLKSGFRLPNDFDHMERQIQWFVESTQKKKEWVQFLIDLPNKISSILKTQFNDIMGSCTIERSNNGLTKILIENQFVKNMQIMFGIATDVNKNNPFALYAYSMWETEKTKYFQTTKECIEFFISEVRTYMNTSKKMISEIFEVHACIPESKFKDSDVFSGKKSKVKELHYKKDEYEYSILIAENKISQKFLHKDGCFYPIHDELKFLDADIIIITNDITKSTTSECGELKLSDFFPNPNAQKIAETEKEEFDR